MTIERQLNSIAESYVKLALNLGIHDKGYVDAYYGDSRWPDEVKISPLSLQGIAAEAEGLLERMAEISIAEIEPFHSLRYEFLLKQIRSMVVRSRFVDGQVLSFDEESAILYDSVAPHHDETYFKALLDKLADELPGEGAIDQRYKAYERKFVIPTDKLDQVFTAAIQESRKRTKQYIELADNENFVVEYVNDKVWSAYNWFKGNNYSLIQINTDFPIFIDRAVDLAAHEGYPGHHVYNSLLENQLYKARGWVEFSIYPLYSPQSLIAEGTANYGIHIVFPPADRIEFEREVLFPLAGLNGVDAEKYYRIQGLVEKLNYVNNAVGRLYLDGKMSRDKAIHWLETYLLYERDRAEQRLRFIEMNRSYVINYNWGQDLVGCYIADSVKDNDSHEQRWQVFKELLSSPRSPSGLLVK